MQMNVGSTDRIVRIVFAVALFALAYYTLTGVWVWIAGVVGIVALVTAFVGTCPLYSILGMSTKVGKT